MKPGLVMIGVAVPMILAVFTVTSPTINLTDSALAQVPCPSTAILCPPPVNLTGNEEVPPVQTEARGVAQFIPFEDFSVYSVNATGIQGVTAGHLHYGVKGENGPIAVTLFKYDTPMNEVSESGTYTAEDLEGPFAGKPLSELRVAGANGSLYVNIHTQENPNGEIRGQ
jgi:CHRD domain